MINETYLTAKEAAGYIKLNVRTFRNYVAAGKIPFRKPEGGPKRYRKSDLDDFMGRRRFRNVKPENN